uniref:Uncharacterized protein n=1 Tax=Oryza glumipatula TaxID=40148 RepID=A0A0D9YH28_9ORYZ
MSDFDFGDLDDMEAHNKREVMASGVGIKCKRSGGGGGFVLKPDRRKGRILNWEEEGDREG